MLLIEIADSSLAYDRTVKRALYARHRIPEFWIVNLKHGEVEVCRQPEGDGYASTSTKKRDAVLDPYRLPGVRIQVAELLG